MFFGLSGEVDVSKGLLQIIAHLSLFLLVFWFVMSLWGKGWAALPIHSQPPQNATGTGGKWRPPMTATQQTAPYIPLPGVAVL